MRPDSRRQGLPWWLMDVAVASTAALLVITALLVGGMRTR
jgi:hypothetical protein